MLVGLLGFVAATTFVRIGMQHAVWNDFLLRDHVLLPTFMVVGPDMTITRLVVAVALLIIIALQLSTTISLSSPYFLLLRRVASVFVVTTSTLDFVALFVVANALLLNSGTVAFAPRLELRIVIKVSPRRAS